MATIDVIKQLEKDGVIISQKHSDSHYFLQWCVLQPEKLPSNLQAMYLKFGEIRWGG